MSKANVLIIEDETVLSLHIQQLLSRWEVNIIGTAKDSETALSLAENNKIDIVISDINILGEMDGIDTSKIIQKKHGSQIIFITGYKDQETIIKASNIDFSGYLLKPFREDELEVLINVIIEKFHLDKSEVININEYHSYNKTKEILYLNNKKLYLSKNENILFNEVFKNINTLVSYSELDIENTKIKSLISSLNIKLKGLIIRNFKETDSVILKFK